MKPSPPKSEPNLPEPKSLTNSSVSRPIPTMSSKPDQETWTHPALKTTTIERLKPPGPGSNYNEWTWFMRAHLNTTDVMYVINDDIAKARANPNWARDNKAAFGAISSTIHAVHVRKVRHITTDARALWTALKEAHQDSSAGGVTYFLRKLTTARMTGDDLTAHLDKMAKTFESLSALITADAPLTLDDIYSSSILTSLPSNWLKTRNEDKALVESVAKASLSRQAPPRSSRPPANHSLFCSFCKRSGHNLEICENAARVLAEHDRRNSSSRRSEAGGRTGKSSGNHFRQKPPAKAGQTTVVDLGGDGDEDDSDYSGSDVDSSAHPSAKAGNAVALVDHAANSAAVSRKDANLDSRCSNCMTPYQSDIRDTKPDSTSIRLADNSTVKASHRGTTDLPLDTSVSVPTLVVPNLHKPLLSIAAIKGSLYYLPSNEVKSLSTSSHKLSSIDSSLLGFHHCLLHIGLKPLKRLLKLLGIKPSIMNEVDVQRCTVCVQSKMHQKPFKSRSPYCSDKPGKLIHLDVGSFEVQSREGYKYFVTFIDDFSKCVSFFPMKSKSNVFSCFKLFRAHFERENSIKILALRSDNSGEYMSTEFSSYLAHSGITHEPGPPHSPELNGVAERTNRTLGNLIRCSLASSGLPKSFWADALRHISFTINSVPCHTPAGFRAPNEILGLPLINPSSLHPFGCLVWYKVPEANRAKLNNKGRSALLLSYLGDGNGYRIWDLEKRSVIKSCDVLFDNVSFPYGSPLKHEPSPVLVELPWPNQSASSNPPVKQTTQSSQAPTPSFFNPPPLDIPLKPKFDRRLTASIHAPKSRSPSPPPLSAPPPSPVSPKSTSPSRPFPPSSSPLPPPPKSTSPSPPSPPLSSLLPPPPLSLPPSPPTSSLTPPQSVPNAVSSEVPAPTPSPLPPPTRRSGRQRRAPDCYGNWAKSAAIPDNDIDTPRTWKQLLCSPHKNRWLKSANDEFLSLLGMDTWRLVPRPTKRKIIKSKWVFKIKRCPDKSIQKLKARLVAMGYSQVQGVDYEEVFAPTLRLETLRLILSLLAIKKWKGRQVDFKTAFLNGRLQEPIYMEQPPGFEDSQHPDWVCEVHRSIYGPKQSPREWNRELHDGLVQAGLQQSKYDPTLYFTIENGALAGAVTVHVDDLAIVGEPSFVDPLIDSLGKRFKIGANEELHHFLSMKIDRDAKNCLLYISQSHYISDLQKRFLSGPSVLVRTPTDSLFKDLVPRKEGELASSGPYPQLIGALLWASQCTRPDVAFAVNRLSQFLRDPSDSHWRAALRVLHYLVSTKHLRLRLGGSLTCAGFSDSDWAEDRHDRRSTSAYTYRLGDGAISWKSRKQATVSLSSTEAEYKALLDSCKEGLWLRYVLTELKLRPQTAIPLHVDNAGAEILAKNPEHHSRTKHIDARYHFSRECVQQGKISVMHVSTKDMLADMLTKPLGRVLLENHRARFGVV
ncbi:hypothetical protein PtA15_5A331 [Puccinia triticina]|uniref:Integrase catalytic domain-containing protein n=1 Tax=Puccinia triticina TaxID=208348 RepID=A0ABY7CHS3_9BASI|nr:uncharacterized protein PtA15_5A331 [Puccinia triticina]WAQ84758.1 hypothetical protein PtA15_5A331 [Puccinia triticina]